MADEVNNTEIGSTEFKTHLGEYLNEAVSSPVFVRRRNQKFVLLDAKEFERLQALDDQYWYQKAVQADQEGYIGEKQTMEFLKNGLNRSE